MFFNKSLQKENQELKEKLYPLEQELGIKFETISGSHLTSLVPEKAKKTKHFQKLKSALEQKHQETSLERRITNY